MNVRNRYLRSVFFSFFSSGLLQEKIKKKRNCLIFKYFLYKIYQCPNVTFIKSIIPRDIAYFEIYVTELCPNLYSREQKFST